MSDYFDRVERQLVTQVQGSPQVSQRWSGAFGLVLPIGAAMIVVAVVVVFISVGHRAGHGAVTGSTQSSIVFQASPASSHSSLGPAIDASVVTLRRRLRFVFPGLRVARSGHAIVVSGASAPIRARVVQLAVPGRLRMFDWEANVLTPNGKSVARQLTAQDPTALTISQGAGGEPGLPGSGALSLYDAVRLASAQPAVQSSQAHLSRLGASYYLFGAPASKACAIVDPSNRPTRISGEHCLLAGPDSTPQSLKADLPAGVSVSDGERLAVPQGTVVLLAANPSAAKPIKANDPTAHYYVLRDNVSLTGADITSPMPSTDQAGRPDVTFGFDPTGERAFQSLTATIARRGLNASDANQALNQHFAIALDTQLITVPSIDFKTYPDGITGGGGADITSMFSPQSAQDLAAILRSGALATNLAVH